VNIIGIFFAVILAFFLIRLAYSRSALKKLDVKLSFSSPRASEGATLTLTTVLTNRKWLPLPWVAVKFSVSKQLLFVDMENSQITDNYYRNDLYNILMRQRITRRLGFVCGKRGYYHIPFVDLTAWDILMEEKSAAAIECGASLTVYPGTLPVPEVDNLCVQIYGQMRARNIMHPDPFSFRGIREYSPHDPLKAINFKASAKAQELMVNQWEYMNARQVILLYNMQRYSVWHNEVLDEYTIKLVASLAERLIQENVPVRFVTNGISINIEDAQKPPNPDTTSLTKKLQRKTKSDASSYIARLKGEDSDKSKTQNPDKKPIPSVTEIPEGIGELQLERILEALAFLDETQTDVAPFADILTKTIEKNKLEPEYWLVSTYHGPDLEAVYKNLLAQGARAVWVLPYSVGLRTREDDISQEIREQVILL